MGGLATHSSPQTPDFSVGVHFVGAWVVGLTFQVLGERVFNIEIQGVGVRGLTSCPSGWH